MEKLAEQTAIQNAQVQAASNGKQGVGFGRRLAASLIDGLIFMVVEMVIPVGMRFLFNIVVSPLYSIVLWVRWNGQTVGKKAMKIKVVKEAGGVLTYREAVIRYFCYFVSGIPLFLGYLWVIWDDKKQGWHDKIAGTLVVKES